MQLSDRLLKTIRKQVLIKPGDRIAAAVSGGADSVALMLLLLELRSELGFVLSVAHVNHKLRGEESDGDQRFVEDLCSAHTLELHCLSAERSPKTGIEAVARELRYNFFRRLAAANPGLKIATGHTLDDQAETVLLRILRGTGIRGLAGIYPRLVLEEQGFAMVEVVRPVLSFRRAELREYLRQRGQLWREDSTNRDAQFLRNRVRNEILPTLTEDFGPAVIENLAALAEIARAEDEHWGLSHPEVCARAGTLDVGLLRLLPVASQRRLLRSWLDVHMPGASFSLSLIEELRELAFSAPEKVLEVASGNLVRRTRAGLCFEAWEEHADRAGYEYPLPIPGEVAIPQLQIQLQAVIMNHEEVPENERSSLLDPDRLPPLLTVRNWRSGDRFWPAHTKEPRKVKELLNDRHITGPEKRLWPVMVAQNELVWIRGFTVPAKFQPQPTASRALLILEKRR